jgi:hypothetical protein
MGLLLLVLVLFLVFGGGFGYYGGHSWGGPGLGIGGILLVVLLFFLIFGGGRF